MDSPARSDSETGSCGSGRPALRRATKPEYRQSPVPGDVRHFKPPACHAVIYLDRTYDCALYLQSIDRIHRLGLPAGVRVRIHILLATLNGGPTIDHLVDASLNAKDARMRMLLEGANLDPIGLADEPAVDAEGSTEDLEALLRFLLGETS